MIKPFVLLYTCLMHFACVDLVQETQIKPAVLTEPNKKPILWTIDWSPDGKFFAIGGDDKLLRIYEGTHYKLVKSYMLPGAIQCLDWNQNGKILAIAIDDNPVQLFNIETENFVILKGVSGSRALAWNNAGLLLAIGDKDGDLQIRNIEGKLIKNIKKDNTKTLLSIDWHPEKNIILTGSDQIRLFDTSGKVLRTIKHRKEETIILSVKWHPGGAFFAVGDYGHKEEAIESVLQFWNEAGTMIGSFRGSKAEYRNIRWNKEGSLLATASDALRLWSTEGKILYTGKTENLLWGLDWNDQQGTIITTSEKGNVNLWSSEAKLAKNIL